MSILADPEVLANVPTPSGVQQSLYLDSVTNQWSTKVVGGTSTVLGGLALSAVGATPNADGATLTTGAPNTLTLEPASATYPGVMTAAQYSKLAQLPTNVYDVTQFGVLPSNTAAANTSAMNTLVGTTVNAGGATFWFPAGAYEFAGAITVGNNSNHFIGSGQWATVLFMTASNDLFTISNGVIDAQFSDFAVWAYSGNLTAGAAFDFGTVSGAGASECVLRRIGTAANASSSLFNIVMFNGNASGLETIIEDCNFNNFTNYGIGLIGNTSTPSTAASLIISNTFINGILQAGGNGAVAGVFIEQCGCVQIIGCGIIESINNLLIAPITSVSQIAASVYSTNTFFDSSFGSCVKLGGTEPIVRCKFVQCSMTVAATASAYSAIEISNTAANPPVGIEFIGCSVQNTFNNTTLGTNGFLITTGADVNITHCGIAGWTNGIQASPSGAAGITRLNIMGNQIGPYGGIKGNGTGILLNAGSFAYGQIIILDNQFPQASAYGAANTTNITDNSTLGTGTSATGFKTIQGNNGLQLMNLPTANYTATIIPATTVTNTDSRGGVFIPATIRPSTIRITVRATNSATAQTLTATVHYGTNNSNADTAIFTQAFTVGTAVVGSGEFVFVVDFLSATTADVQMHFSNGNNAATGIAGVNSFDPGLSAPATIATTANNWLGVYFSSTSASVVTVRSVKYEVLSQ